MGKVSARRSRHCEDGAISSWLMSRSVLLRIAREWLGNRPLFFYVACILPAVMIYLQALAPYAPTFKAQNLSIWSGILGGAGVLLLWIFYRRTRTLNTRNASVIALLIISWLYQVIRTQVDGSVFNLTAFLVPLILLLVLGKPPTQREASHGLLLLGYSLLLISLVSLLFGDFFWAPDGFGVSDAAESRIALLSDIFGITTRWGGPFGSVNMAGPIGGLLIIIGIGQVHWGRWILFTGGITVLGLAQSRTALMATLVALVVYFLWSNQVSRSKFRRLLRLAGVGALALLWVSYVILFDPTLNGRTTIWSDFLGLLPGHFLFGAGDSGINDFVILNSGLPEFIPYFHAHSVLLDGLVRYGLLMLVLSVSIFTISLVTTFRSIPRTGAFSFALVVYVTMAGLTETIHSWNYWSVYILVITSTMLMTGSTRRKVEEVQ